MTYVHVELAAAHVGRLDSSGDLILVGSLGRRLLSHGGGAHVPVVLKQGVSELDRPLVVGETVVELEVAVARAHL